MKDREKEDKKTCVWDKEREKWHVSVWVNLSSIILSVIVISQRTYASISSGETGQLMSPARGLWMWFTEKNIAYNITSVIFLSKYNECNRKETSGEPKLSDINKKPDKYSMSWRAKNGEGNVWD